MNGKGFSPLVKIGDKVKCGQSIMKFSLSDIESAGYATTTAIIITNSQEYNSVDVLVTGFTKKLDEIIKVS
ncbi:PTS system beta-glucoside-specific EIIBCA component [compost metagenome]